MSETSPGPQFETWQGEYWDWVTVALYLLLSVDLLTTTAAVARYGTGGEANPVMRLLLDAGLPVVAAAHLVALPLLGVLFWGIAETVRIAPARVRRPLTLLVEAWLGLLVAAGLFLLANNLVAVAFGASLL